MPPPPIRVPNEGDRRPIGVLHITLTAILFTNREVPDGVPVPLATLAVPPTPPPARPGLFLTVHPQKTAVIHSPDRISLLPKVTLNPHHRKWALTSARTEERQKHLPPAAFSKVRLCPRHRLHSSPHPKALLRKRPLVLTMHPLGRSQKFSRPLPHCPLRHRKVK
jgi:hypothetical protein